ncbi:MAG: hypothetical protein GX600_01625 [Dehalococcoidia bacterium]|nr:hypothetical protein [Dehalococcoidia bacterium]
MSKQQKGMEKALDVGMKLILACLLDATVVACDYNEAKKGLIAPAAHEGTEGPPQS